MLRVNVILKLHWFYFSTTTINLCFMMYTAVSSPIISLFSINVLFHWYNLRQWQTSTSTNVIKPCTCHTIKSLQALSSCLQTPTTLFRHWMPIHKLSTKNIGPIFMPLNLYPNIGAIICRYNSGKMCNVIKVFFLKKQNVIDNETT